MQAPPHFEIKQGLEGCTQICTLQSRGPGADIALWHCAGKGMELPEGGKLKKLVVPPASSLRPIGSGQQPDSSAALHEALAHGNTVSSQCMLTGTSGD